MQAVVTGGAGFIGSNLVDALVERGDDVRVIDNLASGKREHVNGAATLVEHDISESFSLDPADTVFHLAAQADVQTSMKRPAHDAQINVIGTANTLEAARDAGAQMIFSSTGGAIYGECVEPAREDSPLLPMSPYGIAKLCGEEYLRGWNRIHGTTHVALRFANVYGPRQDAGLEGGVVAIFLERLARGLQTAIYGDGLQTRDFVFVGDIVAALLSAAGHPGGTYNVGTGTATTVAELHRVCRSVAGVEKEPRMEVARLGDVQHSVLDASLAERELGWRPRTSLEDGLRKTYTWTTAQV